MKTVVLLSGGLDSATSAYWAKQQFAPDGLIAVSFNYGQRHSIELRAAQMIAEALHVEKHIVIPIASADQWGKSALTCADIPVPNIPLADIGKGDSLPATYVPGRNVLFLSYAFGIACVNHADRIVTGFNVLDYSGYPDCRQSFVAAYQAMLLSLETPEYRTPDIFTPLISLTKLQIIAMALQYGVPYRHTWSCYNPKRDLSIPGEFYIPCGECDSCKLRNAGFLENGISHVNCSGINLED